jgi:metallophosphoesterase (TIGR00282 family)
VNLLFFGDVIGKPGRRALAQILPGLVEEYSAHLVSVNVENAAGGFGMTTDVYNELVGMGMDVLTSGNHIWDKKEFIPELDRLERILRPANYPPGVPGRGLLVVESKEGPVAFLNLSGRIFMGAMDCPFRVADQELDDLPPDVKMIVVDMHAEATSEKTALAHYLDGRVSAVIGTHTHIPTADEIILPKGTALQTDVGMTGPLYSVIGVKASQAISRFLTATPHRFEVASGPVVVNAVFISIKPDGKAESIHRIQKILTKDQKS